MKSVFLVFFLHILLPLTSANQITPSKDFIRYEDCKAIINDVVNQTVQWKITKITKSWQIKLNLKNNIIRTQSKQLEDKNDLLNRMEQTNKNLESRLLIAERQTKSMYETLTDTIISQTKQLRDKEDFLNTMEQTNKNLESRLVSAERQSKSIYEKLTDQINTQAKQLKENDDLRSSMAQTIKDLKSRLESAEGQSKSFIEERTECPIGRPSGIYKIQIPGIEDFEAPCDEDGWLTIQRRMDGSEDFNRTWEDYKNGFGDVRKEFFLGLEKLYRLTDAAQYELCIVLDDVNGTSKYAHYGSFGIDSEAESYRIKDVYNHFLGGPAGHSLIYNAWDKFSTYDRDNDLSNENCAMKYGGGWWYDRCGISTLNGLYLKDGVVRNKVFGIHWGTWSPKAFEFSLTFVEMKIRRINPDL